MSWELDRTQREAVEALDRTVMVVAGPGTGKTRVLTARAVWLTEVEQVDPSRIRAITYTNRATAEMKSRLASRKTADGKDRSPASEVAVSTFHAWAYRLVRDYADALGFSHEPVIFDEDATEQLLLKLLGQKRIPEEALPLRYLKQLIDRTKADVACPLMDKRFDPEHYEVVIDLMRSYQQELDLRGALDFADILIDALRLLHLHPDVREKITGSIDHLLIDEFQDINAAQYRLIEALDHPGLNIFAVGDEDQTIYSFRGSSGVFMDRFVADFGARLIPLGRSYRCSDEILYAAAHLIGQNRRYYQQPPRPPKNLEKNKPIGIFELENEDEESKLVTKLIRSWVEAGCSYRDIAILYRVHYLADECESALINSGIPTIRIAPDRQRKEIPGDPLPLLRLASVETEWDWDRAIGLPRDRLGELDDLRIRLAALKEDVPVNKLLGRPTRFKQLSALAKYQLSGLNKFVRDLSKKARKEAPSMLVNMVADHLDDTRSPWRREEDEWLASEEALQDGFDSISPAAILEEWRASDDGIRIFHAPTITAFLAARTVREACENILGISSAVLPLPFSRDEAKDLAPDSRPVLLIGLDYPPDAFFPEGTLLPRALYIGDEGISDQPPDNSKHGEVFPLSLIAHHLAALLSAYRPGGGEDEFLVFFDLETTGTDIFRDEIVEIAAVKVLLKDGEIREMGHFHSLVKPSRPIPAGAKEVHGISDADVADAPVIKDAIERFLEFTADLPLAGHNIADFDLPIIKRLAGRLLDRVVPNLVIDTLPLAKRLFPGEPHRLGVLAEKFGISVGTAHRALDDVRTNIDVFAEMTRLDEASRSRAFSADAPLMLALASAMDEDSILDPTHLRNAAIRLLARYEGDIENHPFYLGLKESLTSQAASKVIMTLKSMTRSPYEVSPDESALVSRIQMLREEALRLEDENPKVSLGEFLAHIALLTDGDFDSDEDAVRMMTLHAAKGLEFERVIILGFEQGNLPHRLAMNKTVDAIEEERRLCYVGLTRARQRAALVYLRRRGGRWRGRSMFLNELPKQACKVYRTRDHVTGE